MANHRSKWIVFFVLVMLLTLSSCQTKSPTALAVVEGFIEAQNSGDVEASIAFLADDAVIQFIPPAIPEDDGIFTGKEEIRGWYETLAGGNGSSELNDVQVNGDEVTALLTFSDDGLKQLGLDSIDNEWVVTVRDGKIQGYTSFMTEESFEKLMAALASVQTE